MKKILSFVLAAVMAAVLPLSASAAYLGDVNSDGKVNSSDALLVLRHSVGFSDKNFAIGMADVNRDGKINSSDALKILRISVGLDNPEEDLSSKQAILNSYNSSLEELYSKVKRIVVTTEDRGVFTVNGKSESYIFAGDEYNNDVSFVNGFSEDELPPEAYGPGTELTASMVKTVSLLKSDGDLFNLVLFSEKVDIKDEPVYNAAGAFVFELSSDGTPITEYTSGSVTYSGTEITMHTNDGKNAPTEIKVVIPYESSYTMKHKNGKTDVITEKGTYTYTAMIYC